MDSSDISELEELKRVLTTKMKELDKILETRSPASKRLRLEDQSDPQQPLAQDSFTSNILIKSAQLTAPEKQTASGINWSFEFAMKTAIAIRDSHETSVSSIFGSRPASVTKYPCKKELIHLWNGVHNYNHKCPLRFCSCTNCTRLDPLGIAKTKVLSIEHQGSQVKVSFDSFMNVRLEEFLTTQDFIPGYVDLRW